MTKGQHFLLGLLTLIIAAAVAGIGYLVGNSSHTVTYQQVSKVYIAHYISGTDDNHHVSYLQLEDQRLFYVHELDFSPRFSAAALGQTGYVSFVYSSDSATSIDVNSTGGTHLSGNAYRIIAIAALETGQLYTTDVYAQHPNGYFSSRQDVAYLLFGIAGLIALSALIFRGRGLLMAAAIAGGAIALPLAWFILLDVLSGADWGSGSSIAGQQILIAKAAAGGGAVLGAIIGTVVVFSKRSDDQYQRRRRERKAKRASQRRQSETQAEAALQGTPTTWADWANRGSQLNTLHRYDEALQACDRALALSPSDNPLLWAILNNKAEVLRNLKRYTEALEVNDRAYALQPNNPNVLKTRGIVLMALRRFAEAVEVYEHLLRVAPNDIEGMNNLAAALSQVGRTQDAIRMCEAVLKLDPDNGTARHNLSTLRNDPHTTRVVESDDD